MDTPRESAWIEENGRRLMSINAVGAMTSIFIKSIKVVAHGEEDRVCVLSGRADGCFRGFRFEVGERMHG
jgi:hypothetical protein